MELFQSELSAMLPVGIAIVLVFALPVATRRWAWLWPLVVLAALGFAVNAYLTFTDFWGDRHGFLRMWVAVLAWPFIVGLFVRGIVALLDRPAGPGFRRLFWAAAVLGLLVAVAPYVLLLL